MYARFHVQENQGDSKSAEEQANQYKDMLLDDEAGKSLTDPDTFPSYSNCKVIEKGAMSIGEVKGKIFEVRYTATYSDKGYEQKKAKNPNLKKSSEISHYYFIAREGAHAMNVSATDRKLLDTFLKSLLVSW